MKSVLCALAVVAALALPGCSGLDNTFGKNATESSWIHIDPAEVQSGDPGVALLLTPFAFLQVLYDLAQGY
jgi:hypothetical protein